MAGENQRGGREDQKREKAKLKRKEHVQCLMHHLHKEDVHI